MSIDFLRKESLQLLPSLSTFLVILNKATTFFRQYTYLFIIHITFSLNVLLMSPKDLSYVIKVKGLILNTLQVNLDIYQAFRPCLPKIKI